MELDPLCTEPAPVHARQPLLRRLRREIVSALWQQPLWAVPFALIFGTLSNGMNMLGVNSNWQLIITGQILLGASMLDALSSKKVA